MAEVGTSSSGDGESAAPDKPKGSVKFTEADLAAIKQTSDTLKRNPKMDFSKADLLKLLSYLEGELQARDVVIAVLKTEKIKQLLTAPRYSKPPNLNDPHAALFRDQLAASGNIASRQSSFQAAHSEHEMRLMSDQRTGVREQMDSLAALVMQQRQAQAKMIEALKDAEERHKRVVQELYDERRKHEHTTAQGDDITYGLEIERSRLKQELDHEKDQHKVLEIELKKVQEQFEAEKNRQKQIVLLLLAERKKIIIKYIEERKRSEDLAQILSEEKQRVDTIAEGLEEESKKSLRMEAELEKQAQQFELERKLLHQSLAKEEKRVKEQEVEIQQLKAEIELLRKQTGIRHPLVAPQLPTKPGGLVPSRPSIAGAGPGGVPSVGAAGSPSSLGATVTSGSIGIPGQMISSMATKVVQPTATVSSVPVTAPTTGIARSVSPGQLIRQTAISQLSVTSPPLVGAAAPAAGGAGAAAGAIGTTPPVPAGASPDTYANTPAGKMAACAAGVRKAATTAIGGGSAATAAAGSPMSGSTATIKKTIILPVGGRGVPPPIPPNKPQIPPKLSGVSAVAAVAAGAVSSRIPFLSNSGGSSSSSSSSSGSSTGSINSSTTTPVSPVSSSIGGSNALSSSTACNSSSSSSSSNSSSATSSSNSVASSSGSIINSNTSAQQPCPPSHNTTTGTAITTAMNINTTNTTTTPPSSTNNSNNAASAPNALLQQQQQHHTHPVPPLYTHHPHHVSHLAHVAGTGGASTNAPAAATAATATATGGGATQQQQGFATAAASAPSVPSAATGGPSEVLTTTNLGCEGGIV
ncbi:CTTNBP2 N-terminal-like protein isoform X1 [Anopheles arabiensis]|uniref:CTTNBP2 N-terminal-like protein isoform X1 n=2 Tax=Anopheles arabiensis TaxID=7173 RepID=UPI001AAE0A60|nr:CTTNBP2 N-terminal-like protein isoform X1 [Anopheles arabiensis]XP_040166926.1 CTTNBP2 N-terminal-like protein isoform X1 [Anopheles arabiensis]XP_040166927.1 CTTNBP2 N-terminal-like protein isoform X1 [Anopheles arabiensis]XP_040166929.1 CTTNBP2 N-terminal-like protein isoform X1 [Anopheles arabiensis]XP_040166930.1 CTTNBP2 N-terminal-like protein isoform X1 [Anopheles arabiensis]